MTKEEIKKEALKHAELLIEKAIADGMVEKIVRTAANEVEKLTPDVIDLMIEAGLPKATAQFKEYLSAQAEKISDEV